jgi:hypothetical protein
MATYLNDLGYLARIPVLYLVLLVVGVPWAAVAAGWLLSGREPPAIAQPSSSDALAAQRDGCHAEVVTAGSTGALAGGSPSMYD